MVAPQPLKKYDHIRGRIDEFADAGRPLDEFSIRWVQKETDSMALATPALGDALRGYLAAYNWQEKDAVTYFEAALAEGGGPGVRFDYVRALWWLARPFEAQQQAILLANDQPGHPAIVWLAMIASSFVGDFRHCIEFCKRHMELKNLSTSVDHDAYAGAAAVIGDSPATWEMVSQCHKVAFDLMREHKVRSRCVRIDVEDDADPKGVLVYIRLLTTPEHAFDLDRLLADRLFDGVPTLDLNRYWVGFEAEQA